MNQDNNNDMPVQQALVEKKSPISSIWLLPVIAALIGLWLLFQAFNDSGIDITIRVDSADGITIGKTEVRYKGFPLGVVTDLDFTDDLNFVDVTVEMNRNTDKYLTENSLIWLVKPEISLSGVSGLDTVITGNYFEMLPELGKQNVRNFVSLKKPPPKAEDSPGLHLTLHAKELGSVTHGTNIYYKQIVVGEVYAYDFSEDKGHIEIKLLIEEEYKDLIKLNTRFWNASGVELTGDLSGFKVRTQSFASIVGGGIAFYTPELGDTTTKVQNFTEYPLFEGFDEARAGINVKMHFPKDSGIRAGITKVIFEGVEVGLVEDFVYDKERGGVTADVSFDPRLEPYLLSEMEFWLVKPSISLSGISNVDRLLSGSYISFRLGGGAPAREFDVLPTAPAIKFDQPGLHLNIVADSVDSLSFGAPIFYKNLQVGSVQDHQLTEDKRRFNVHIFIEPEYMDLVNSTSVFYEQGGIEMSGSILQTFSIKTAPMQAMLAGGLAFQTIDFENGGNVKNGHTFPLNSNLEDALNTETITIIADDKFDIIPGITKLLLGDKQIGLVRDVKPSSDLKSAIVTVGYQADFKGVFKETSKVWIVEPKLSSGYVAGFNALITGAFLQVKQGKGAAKSSFELLRKAPRKIAEDEGLQLRLNAKHAGSIDVGSPITFKKMYIGEIESIDFSDDKLSIDVFVTIEEQFRYLIADGSSFYLASGFKVDADMTGMTVQTESMQSIIRGGIALDNHRANLYKPVDELTTFTLHESYQDMLETGKDINITFNQVIDINENATVQFNSHIVGHVKTVKLNPELTKTFLTVSLNKDYINLAKETTQFWHVKPHVSPARVANTKAFFTGNYLGVKPGSGNDKQDFIGLTFEPAKTTLPSGLNLTLTNTSRGSLQPESPIYYRQIKVGKVLGSSLNTDADGVLIYINIEEQFKHLVNSSSKFYNVSGFKVDAGLFSGMKVNTESLETILAGGIAFATQTENAESLYNGAKIKLNNEAKDDWLKWSPKLTK
ncbi:PqiB family protein [Thalassomonas sp. M1454]|uniref:PqiB family protein n=1 Tax=Thalassomonas sp. M1454 TaxID=2594477 RepID=UPI00117E0F65|nr:MlaD family protein [Thalassomonas sp. M1454]TRX56870.1 MCE family protein [Thalassomonas sp. M1454]